MNSYTLFDKDGSIILRQTNNYAQATSLCAQLDGSWIVDATDGRIVHHNNADMSPGRPPFSCGLN